MHRQPDQKASHWDNHVLLYETVFEPFSQCFAKTLWNKLNLKSGQSILDVGAGSGALALELASHGLNVTAIDFSPQMVERIRTKAKDRNLSLQTCIMDGQYLSIKDNTFDAAISVFGVILFPDAKRGVAEMSRVVAPGGTCSLITWTQPENYALIAELRTAIDEVVPPQVSPGPLPAQLRFRDKDAFHSLLASADLKDIEIETVRAHLTAPTAQWLAERIDFAPGMDALMKSLGDKKNRILDIFERNLEAKHGAGEIQLEGVAFIGIGRVP